MSGFGPKLSKHVPRKKSRISRVEQVFKFSFPKSYKIQLPPVPSLSFIKNSKVRGRRLKILRYFRDRSVYRFISRLPNVLYSLYGITQGSTVDLISYYVSSFESRVAFNDAPHTIDLLKKIHGVCQRYCANSSFEKIPFIENDANGLPLYVKPFSSLLSGSINDRRCALCILSLYKMVIVRGEEPSLKSIVDPFVPFFEWNGLERGEFFKKVSSKLEHSFRSPNFIARSFRDVLEEMFPKRKWKRRLKSISRCSGLHVSSRNGPNGPAVLTSRIDLYALCQQPDLMEAIDKLARLIDHKDLLDFLTNDPTFDGTIDIIGRRSPLHSRLSIKIEPGAKTRFFAICDYFTQSVLKGFHKWIFRYLSTLPGDGTKSQDQVCSIVKRWTSMASEGSVKVYSTDLSKATDRLPSLLQREIIWHIAGKDFSNLWYTIITQRSFQLPNSDHSVKFEVGQPLGAYSSWAMLALTHHVICRLALKLIGKQYDNVNPSFVIVGDDNALIGQKFEESYRFVMVGLCKVSVSPLKGFSPEVLSGANPVIPYANHSVAEFCKRVFINGHELSTVSPMTLKAAMEYPSDFPMLISDMFKRDTWPDLDGVMLVAWMNYNPDQALTLSSFPLTTALPSNILVGLASLRGPLGLKCLEEDLQVFLKPLYIGQILETVNSEVLEFSSKVAAFKQSLDDPFGNQHYFQRAPRFYRRMLGLVCDQITYSVVKSIDRIKPQVLETQFIKKIISGIVDLDDFRKVISFDKNNPAQDRPKRVSNRLSKLISECSKVLKGDKSKALAYFARYNTDESSTSEKIESSKDFIFIDAEDDWTFVVPKLDDDDDEFGM